MKLLRATIEGFRAFTKRVDVDLSSDVTILVGPNGTGKTSLLDALLWGITGRLKRVGDQKRVLSLYAPAGLARVSIEIADKNGSMLLVRTFLEGEMNVALKTSDANVEGPAADVEIVRRLWDAGSSNATPLDDLHDVMTRTVYLQQDLVRQFVDRDSADERFDAISSLIGVGKIADFQRRLVSSRKAWATAMGQRENALAEADRRLTSIRADIARLGRDVKDSDAAAQWSAWWNGLLDKGLGIRPIPDVATPNSAQVLEQMLRALQTARVSIQRKLSTLPQIREDMVLLADAVEIPDNEIQRLKSAVTSANAACKRLEELIVVAEEHGARVRAELLVQKNASEEMRALASLALRHLSEHCPVCEQSIDAKLVEARLRRLIGKDSSQQEDAGGEAPKLLTELERTRQDLQKAERDLENALNANKSIASRRTLLNSQLANIELEASNVDAVDSLATLLGGQVAEISEAYKLGEALSLAIVRLSEEGKREDLIQQEARAVGIVGLARSGFEDYKATHEEASRIIEAVRAVSDEAVNRQIDRIGPLLQKIYTRIDPHPTFRVAELRSYISYGKGRVETPVTDLRGGSGKIEVDAPAEIFSSSQTSALAVSIFLAMNLSSDTTPLQTAILDDPLQSLDDINLLGLLDVLRRTRERRQLLISTHDEKFAALLRRKFRPVAEGQQTSLVTLGNWERAGVNLSQDYESDVPVRLQVVS